MNRHSATIVFLMTFVIGIYGCNMNSMIKSSNTSEQDSKIVVSTFKCSKFTPAMNQIVKPNVCDDNIFWLYDFQGRTAETVATENVSQNSNMGGAIFHFPDGKDRIIYRSSFMAELNNERGDKRECLAELVSRHNLTDIINYYDGHFSNKDALMSSERDIFKSVGGENYVQIKGFEYRLNYELQGGAPINKSIDVYKNVKRVVASIDQASGNVLIHCFGGMHRTGIAYGILQKCYNKVSMDHIEEEYKCHVRYEGPEKEGGFLQESINLIENFPCEALESLDNTDVLTPNSSGEETYSANW